MADGDGSERLATQISSLSEVVDAYAEAAGAYSGVLDAIVHKLAGEVGDLCSLLVLSDDSKTLEVVAMHGRDPAVLALAREVFDGKQIAVVPIQRRAMNLGATFIARHVAAEGTRGLTTPERVAFVERIGMSSVTTVGLRARDHAVGILNLLRHGPDRRPYDDDDRALLQKVAAPIALAVGNARLLRQQLDALRGARAVAVRALSELEALSSLASEANTFAMPTVRGYADALDDQIEEVLRQAGAEYLPRLRGDAQELQVTIDDLLK